MRAVLGIGGTIVLFSFWSCANQGAPPGGPQDRTGPQVVATLPDTFAVLEAFDREIEVMFDERISERGVQGALDGAVVVSPESGEVRVRHSSRSLRVGMEGGFRPDEVYRVTVLPVVQDLFGNAMPDPFEFVFSTGAEMTPTVLAGSIVDRITGQPVVGARVTARAEGTARVEDSGDQVIPTHVASTDEGGVYAFRFVPAGRYDIAAFTDENRNRVYDGNEPIATGQEQLNLADTVFLDLALLAPDTTPAMVGRADVVDSLTLEVRFDDFLDPDLDLAEVSGSLGPDSLPAVDVVTIIHERDYLALQDAIEDSLYAADSIRFEGDQQRVDSLLSAGDSTAAAELEVQLISPRPRPPSAPRESLERDLPKQVLFFLLSDTLVTDRAYELSVTGVTNINGVPGGGGAVEVIREGPEADEPVDDLPPPDGADPPPDPANPPPDPANPGALPGLQPSLRRE